MAHHRALFRLACGPAEGSRSDFVFPLHTLREAYVLSQDFARGQRLEPMRPGLRQPIVHEHAVAPPTDGDIRRRLALEEDMRHHPVPGVRLGDV